MNTPASEAKPFRSLSLDGGGMRGLYTAAVLNSLSERYSPKNPLDLGKGFDLIVGTSTGGILATALAAGVPLSKVIGLYKDHGPLIFKDPMPKGGLKRSLWGISHFNEAANSNQPLSEALQAIFKDETVGQLFERRKIGLCLASVNIATHKARVFKTGHDPQKTADDRRFLRDICLATSAAPIVLPVAGIPDPLATGELSHFVDGGLWANNPILIALVESMIMAKPEQPIEIISIGTCPPPGGSSLTPKEANRGLYDWGFGIKALDLSMDAQASGNQFIASFIAQSLKKCGKDLTITRLEQSSPSQEHAESLSLDNPSQKACSTLIQLGHSDGLEIYGKSLTPNSDYKTLSDIFKSMPQMAEGDHK